MDVRRHAALFGPLREGSGPLSDLVWTLEVRGKAQHEHAGGDGLGGKAQLFVQRFVRVRDSRLRHVGDLADLAYQPREAVAPEGSVGAGRSDGRGGSASKQVPLRALRKS